MEIVTPALPVRSTGRPLGSWWKWAFGSCPTVKAGVPLVKVNVNVSPETTADTIELDGGSGTDHVLEAWPEEVQLKLAVATGEVCAAVRVEVPQPDRSNTPRVATTARY